MNGVKLDGVEYTETLVSIDNVSYVAGSTTILKGVNAEIRNVKGHGQIVGILGPSGVGKTTLFRIMAGLDKPTEGAVTINCDGEDGCLRTVSRGEVGVVTQEYPLFVHYTIEKNLVVAAGMKNNKSEKEKRELIKYFLSKFDLLEQAKKYPYQLSGGQRQRIAIIQQILCSDYFILMDEPFSGLDLIAKKMVIELIKEAADMDERNTTVVVTHDPESAVLVADELWLMGRERNAEGKIIPGASIQDAIDLKARGLAWHDELEFMPEFAETIREIRRTFYTL